MKESYRKSLASDPDPESCAARRKTGSEALTGAHAGRPLSCEIRASRVPTASSSPEGHTTPGAIGEPGVDSAQSKTPCMHGNSTRENRETLELARMRLCGSGRRRR